MPVDVSLLGLPPDVTDGQQKAMLERQEHFLTAYAKHGTVARSCKEAGVHRSMPSDWVKDERYGFAKRWEEAKEEFREELESIMFKRFADPKCNPLLHIFVMKAHWPQKYAEAATETDDTAKEVATLLKEAARRKKQRKEQETKEVREAEDIVRGNGQ